MTTENIPEIDASASRAGTIVFLGCVGLAVFVTAYAANYLHDIEQPTNISANSQATKDIGKSVLIPEIGLADTILLGAGSFVLASTRKKP